MYIYTNADLQDAEMSTSIQEGWQLCVLYHKLITVTKQDAYPPSRIDKSLDELASCKYFSMLHLAIGYWQIPLDGKAQEKAAFIT